MPKLPLPPLKQVGLSIALDKLRIFVPAAVVLGLLVAFVPSVALLLVPRAAPPAPPRSEAPSQEWTTGAEPLRTLTSVTLGALPAPDPRQRKPPCAAKIGEEAISGYCWLRLDVRPPCPQDSDAMAYEHNGKCYGYALRAAGIPTSGDFQRSSVAGP